MNCRGSTVEMPPWWRERALELITRLHGRERNSTELDLLGKRLADRIDRKSAYDRGTLKNTALGKRPYTFELVRALQLEFPSLPAGLFFPRSIDESMQMATVQHEFDQRDMPSLEEQREAARKREAEERIAQQAREAGERNRAFRVGQGTQPTPRVSRSTRR